MAAPDENAVELPTPENVTPQWHTPATIGVVAAGLGVFAVIAAIKPGVDFTDRAFVDAGATRAVQTDVQDTITALYAYDPAGVDNYVAAVRPRLTGEMQCAFDATAAETVQWVTDTQTKADVVVDAVGVSDLTSDAASVVVSLTSTWSERGTARGSESRQLSVAVAKVDGEWLVSEVTDLREPGRSDDCPRSN